MRSSRSATKSSSCSSQLEKARTQQRRPNAAKNKNKKIFLKIVQKRDILNGTVTDYDV